MDQKKQLTKLRGGYYTSMPIVKFLISWAIKGKSNPSVLEPSMGDGIFIEELAKSLLKNGINETDIGKNIFGVELLEKEVKKAKLRLANLGFNDSKFNLFVGDYFHIHENSLKSKEFDIVLGNPPFIRYQNFPEEQRSKAIKILNEYGFKPNKLTNAWLFFLLASIKLLKADGKIAMVIPSELLQVTYSREARLFLSNFFNSINIITFKKLVFEGVQQEIVLILGDRLKNQKEGIDLIEIKNTDELQGLQEKLLQPDHFKSVDHISDKWIQYFLDEDEILLLREVYKNSRLKKFGNLASVDVGVVTGNNKYFVLNKDKIEKYSLENYVIELVGRSSNFNGGVIFNKNDWKKLKVKGSPVFLFNVPNSIKIENGLNKYIEYGEELKVNEGYKCSIRKLWYSVPSIWIPDLFLLRQIHEYPRLILNNAKAVPTDTIHRVALNNNISAEKITISFLNSLTFAFSEIFGRSYGGGVLELEPNEAEELPIPFFENLNLDIKEIDTLLKSNDIEKVLQITDEQLLKKFLGLSNDTILKLRKIWKKLSGRRVNRKKP